jgi:ligand-binding sensor domain-containing protein
MTFIMEELGMKTRGLLLVVCALTVSSVGFSAVGTWKNFTSMKEVRSLTRNGLTFWAATSGGLFGWNSSNNSYQRYTNAEGLQSTDLTALGIDSNGNVWTGTSSGLIHVYSPRTATWRYILDIANTNQTNKRINSFTMLGDTVFVCTEFGMSVFRIDRFEFGDTYTQFGTLQGNVRVSVTSAVVFNDSLWLTVSDGNISRVAVASLTTPNLLPPESWSLRTVGGFTVVSRQLVVFNGKLYAATNTGLFDYTSGSWNALPTLSGLNIVALSSSSLLSVCTQTEAYTVDRQENVLQRGGSLPSLANTLTESPEGLPVVGSKDGGILTLDSASAWISRLPNGPNSNQFLSIAVNTDGTVWAASGFSGNGKGIYRYNGRDWKSFTAQNSPLPVNDYYRVSVGCNGSVWASAYGWGIAEIPLGADSISRSRIYGRNVGMVGLSVDFDFIVTSTVVCDGSRNTWTTIVLPANKRLLAYQRAGCDTCWSTYPVYLSGVQMTNLQDRQINRCLAIDPYGNLWAGVRQDGLLGVISLGNRGTLDDTTVAYHITSNDGLPSNSVTEVVVDLDGQVWVGTERGIAIITNPLNPRQAGGIAGYKPLPGTVVNCIAVDALNQKWVGTPDGVIVLSPDGIQQVTTYTVASTNGKLIDNDVKSIAIDGGTGTVYFGTLSGLASLTTVSATPQVAFDKLQLFPNPFLIPTDAEVTIDGLVENSTLKILSIDGSLVRQITPPGGRIGFWDGKDDDGKLVASGVYIVVASSEKDETVAKAKLAVIRR